MSALRPHAEALPAIPDSEEQCVAFVELLARQLNDLTALRDQVEKRYQFWSNHLEGLRAGNEPKVRKARARRGELREALKAILASHPDGARIADIHAELLRLLPQYRNRHSISETLRRMRESGELRHEGEHWRLHDR